MTTPLERRESVKYARAFLIALLDAKATPRVPKAVRQEARRRLRHYPFNFEVDQIWKRAQIDTTY